MIIPVMSSLIVVSLKEGKPVIMAKCSFNPLTISSTRRLAFSKFTAIALTVQILVSRGCN